MSNRRAFLRAVAAAPLVPAALTQTAPAPPPPWPSPSPSASPGDAPSPLAEALGEAVRVRYAEHLSPGDVAEIKKMVHGNLQAAGRLKTVRLTNADEPVTAFAARVPGRAPEPAAPAPPRRPRPRRRGRV